MRIPPQSRRSAARPWLLAALLLPLCAGVALAVGAAPAAAATASTAQIWDARGNVPLNAGASKTQFTLALPASAHCAGDSTQMPFYRSYSYLIPQGTAPTAVNFKTGQPDKWYGISAYGTYYGAVNVVRGTGQIAPVIPNNLTFDPLTADQVLPSGARTATWETGVACTTYKGDVTAYWNVEVVFTRSATDPDGFTWAVSRHVHVPGSSSAGFDIAGIVVALILAAGAVALVRSNRTAKAGARTAR